MLPLLAQGGRLCLAVPSSDAQPKGIVLGGSSAAGVLYVEPQAAVPLNNDLAAARGEAYAAVESVLWKLTGLIADAVDDMQRVLDTVRPCALLKQSVSVITAGACRSLGFRARFQNSTPLACLPSRPAVLLASKGLLLMLQEALLEGISWFPVC